MSEESKTYSIALRLRRVIQEDAYVSVFVTDAITKEPNAEGKGWIDFDALVAEAIRLGQVEGVDWQVEESHIEPHPIQGPLPEGRRVLDSFYLRSDSDSPEPEPPH